MSRLQAVAFVDSDGNTLSVTNEHRTITPATFADAAENAGDAGIHLWVVTTAHAVSMDDLEHMADEPLRLDSGSHLATALGCYVCEQPWTFAATRRRCPGEPDACVPAVGEKA